MNKALSSFTSAPNHVFAIGEKVRVIKASPPGHRRTPAYIRGKIGTIERICGVYPNPEELAYGFDGVPKRVLYRVAFKQVDVWTNYKGQIQDLIEMELFEHWLAPLD